MNTMATVTRGLARSVLSLMFFLICLEQTLGQDQDQDLGIFVDVFPSECVCPSDTRIYECQYDTEGATIIWNGTAFKCPSMNNQIRHKPNGTITDSCSNGSIRLMSSSEQSNSTTSKLIVTITPETAGKTIECFTTINGSSTMPTSYLIPNITDTGPLSNLNEVLVNYFYSNSSLRLIVFNWNPAALNCSATYYNIRTSNCGNCTTTTNKSFAICTNVPLNNGNYCTFAIQTVFCGNKPSNFTDLFRSNFCSTMNTTGSILTSPSQTVITHCSDTNTVYIASISSLAVALVVTIVALVITTSIVLVKIGVKRKITYHLPQNNNKKDERNTYMETVYKENIEPLPTVSVVGIID